MSHSWITHSFIHLLNHSLTHSPTHSHTHSIGSFRKLLGGSHVAAAWKLECSRLLAGSWQPLEAVGSRSHHWKALERTKGVRRTGDWMWMWMWTWKWGIKKGNGRLQMTEITEARPTNKRTYLCIYVSSIWYLVSSAVAHYSPWTARLYLTDTHALGCLSNKRELRM